MTDPPIALADPDLTDLDRGRRASIILRADLRGQLPDPPPGPDGRPGPKPSPVVAKAVLFVLDSFPPDRCFPGEALIARSACTSTRTLRRALAALIAGGFVETRDRPVKATRLASTRYYLIRYDRLGPLDPRHQHLERPGGAPAILAGAPSPGHDGAPAPATMAGQPRPDWPTTASISTPESPSKHRANGDRDHVLQELRTARDIEDVVPDLLRIGFTKTRARSLTRSTGARRIRQVLALLEERGRKVRIANPPGFVTQAIRENWTGTSAAAGGRP